MTEDAVPKIFYSPEPFVVRESRRLARLLNPSQDVRALHEKNFRDACRREPPAELAGIGPALRSDWIRLSCLTNTGGV